MNLASVTDQIDPHNISVLLHVSFGSLGIFLGIIQLFTNKGGATHRRLGDVFICCSMVVIFTAAVGAVFFNFRAFLVALTITASYVCFAGYRVLYLRGQRPAWIDNFIAATGILFSLGFYYWIGTTSSVMPSATVSVTLVSLVVHCSYDLLRNLFPYRWLQRIWLLEHMVKMVSALGALLSAAIGNLLPSFGAVSQLLPSLIGFTLMFLFAAPTLRATKERAQLRLSNRIRTPQQ